MIYGENLQTWRITPYAPYVWMWIIHHPWRLQLISPVSCCGKHIFYHGFLVETDLRSWWVVYIYIIILHIWYYIYICVKLLEGHSEVCTGSQVVKPWKIQYFLKFTSCTGEYLSACWWSPHFIPTCVGQSSCICRNTCSTSVRRRCLYPTWTIPDSLEKVYLPICWITYLWHGPIPIPSGNLP